MPRTWNPIVSAVLAALALAAVGEAGAASTARTASPAARHYIAILKARYLPLRTAFGVAVPPCTQSPPDAASLSSCRRLDAVVSTKTKVLLAALRRVRVPASLKARDPTLKAALHVFLAAIDARIAFIDRRQIARFTAADAKVGVAIGLVDDAVSAIDPNLPGLIS